MLERPFAVRDGILLADMWSKVFLEHDSELRIQLVRNLLEVDESNGISTSQRYEICLMALDDVCADIRAVALNALLHADFSDLVNGNQFQIVCEFYSSVMRRLALVRYALHQIPYSSVRFGFVLTRLEYELLIESLFTNPTAEASVRDKTESNIFTILERVWHRENIPQCLVELSDRELVQDRDVKLFFQSRKGRYIFAIWACSRYSLADRFGRFSIGGRDYFNSIIRAVESHANLLKRESAGIDRIADVYSILLVNESLAHLLEYLELSALNFSVLSGPFGYLRMRNEFGVSKAHASLLEFYAKNKSVLELKFGVALQKSSKYYKFVGLSGSQLRRLWLDINEQWTLKKWPSKSICELFSLMNDLELTSATRGYKSILWQAPVYMATKMPGAFIPDSQIDSAKPCANFPKSAEKWMDAERRKSLLALSVWDDAPSVIRSKVVHESECNALVDQLNLNVERATLTTGEGASSLLALDQSLTENLWRLHFLNQAESSVSSLATLKVKLTSVFNGLQQFNSERLDKEGFYWLLCVGGAGCLSEISSTAAREKLSVSFTGEDMTFEQGSCLLNKLRLESRKPLAKLADEISPNVLYKLYVASSLRKGLCTSIEFPREFINGLCSSLNRGDMDGGRVRITPPLPSPRRLVTHVLGAAPNDFSELETLASELGVDFPSEFTVSLAAALWLQLTDYLSQINGLFDSEDKPFPFSLSRSEPSRSTCESIHALERLFSEHGDELRRLVSNSIKTLFNLDGHLKDVEQAAVPGQTVQEDDPLLDNCREYISTGASMPEEPADASDFEAESDTADERQSVLCSSAAEVASSLLLAVAQPTVSKVVGKVRGMILSSAECLKRVQQVAIRGQPLFNSVTLSRLLQLYQMAPKDCRHCISELPLRRWADGLDCLLAFYKYKANENDEIKSILRSFGEAYPGILFPKLLYENLSSAKLKHIMTSANVLKWRQVLNWKKVMRNVARLPAETALFYFESCRERLRLKRSLNQSLFAVEIPEWLTKFKARCGRNDADTVALLEQYQVSSLEGLDAVVSKLKEQVAKVKSFKLLRVAGSLLERGACGFPFSKDACSENIVWLRDCEELAIALGTKTLPKKIVALGDDGRRYPFLLKYSEDLKQDDNLQSLFRMLNQVLPKDSKVVTYCVAPLSKTLGMVEWVQCATSLYKVEQDHIRSHRKLPELVRELTPSRQLLNACERGNLDQSMLDVPRKEWPKAFAESLYEAMKEHGQRSENALRDYISQSQLTSFDWHVAQLRYCQSLASMSIIGWFLGIGDRHLDNILYRAYDGSVVHIDFNICFDRPLKLSIPETVPFRLTSMLLTALGPLGLHGPFKTTCVETLKVLRLHISLLYESLLVFIWSPVQQRISFPGESRVRADHAAIERALERISFCSQRVDKVTQSLPLFSEFDPLNNSLDILQTKVEELVAQATSADRLAKMYDGWKFWS